MGYSERETIKRRNPSTSAMDDIAQKRLRGMYEIGTKMGL